MKLIKEASAGTLDSCDINIRLDVNPAGGNQVHLTSVVEKQYGEHIRDLINKLLEKYGLEDVTVNVVDRGALDCTIKARMESAILRGIDRENSFDWSVIHNE